MVTLAPIPARSPEPPLLDTINGVCVNTNPMGTEVKEVIDIKRERSGRVAGREMNQVAK
jgi:hypothetical protein